MTALTLGRYLLDTTLGEGGMGVVYQARDPQLNRTVAIKVLPADQVVDPDRKRRFAQEAQAASALNHPNIVAIYDVGSDGGRDFIVMEHVAGADPGAAPSGWRVAGDAGARLRRPDRRCARRGPRRRESSIAI